MATNWQNFEIDCIKYLNSKYSRFAKFIHYGGSNSYMPDIWVETKTNQTFGLEAKQCPAQCGQFVLLPNIATREFNYSHLNFTPFTKNATIIMYHMNMNFDAYKEAGTKGTEIIFERCKTVFANWVIEYYKI